MSCPILKHGQLWAIIPQTVREKENIPIAIAVFTFASNLGMLIGPPLVGFTADVFGWKAVSVLFAMAILPGAMTMLLVKDCATHPMARWLSQPKSHLAISAIKKHTPK